MLEIGFREDFEACLLMPSASTWAEVVNVTLSLAFK
jgi:hypothetical protein